MSVEIVGSSPIFSFFGVCYIRVFWSASFEERPPDPDRAGESNGPFLSLEMAWVWQNGEPSLINKTEN